MFLKYKFPWQYKFVLQAAHSCHSTAPHCKDDIIITSHEFAIEYLQEAPSTASAVELYDAQLLAQEEAFLRSLGWQEESDDDAQGAHITSMHVHSMHTLV